MTENRPNGGRRRYSAALFILLALIPLCFGSILVLLYIFNKNSKEKHTKDRPEKYPQPGTDLKYNGNGSGVFEKFAISSEHPECSKAGIKMMKLGGNAVDAAIAALLCIGVVNNFSSGIGGGGFMLVKKAKGKINSTEDDGVVIDFRETAPVNSTEGMFIGKPNDATEGGKSVAIPGELRGFELARNRFPSKLPWKELFGPAIELAEHGFPVNRRLKYLVGRYKDVINRHAPLKRLYMDEKGEPFPVGAILKRQNLAKTLRIIAEKGADAFYTGDIAQDTINMIRENQGIMGMEDLAGYQSIIRNPLKSTYRGFEVTSPGPPSSGIIVAYILNILEGMELKSPYKSLYLHRIIEAGKFGFAARMKLGDPNYVEGMGKIVKELLDPKKAEQARAGIDDERTWKPDHYLDEYFDRLDEHGTTQVSVIDLDGLAVSVTSTVNQAFGSMLMSENTGILLNDHMDDFSTPNMPNSFGLPPSPHNFIHPGKRPMSSAAPLIISDKATGRVFMVTGAVGGSKIISATTRSVVDLVDFGISPEASVNQARLHHQLIPDVLNAENGNDPKIIKELRERGHEIKQMESGKFYAAVSMVQCRRSDGLLFAAADPRKGGDVTGF
jgi:gamma-glutamyltranspeptidase / glutathione hydrolase / leukotriene-C4 hydrolase